MKTTGLLAAGEDLVDRLDPGAAVLQLNVRHDQLRLPLRRQGDRLAVAARDADHAVTEIFDDRFEVHRDDRLVLDDQDARGEFMREIAGAMVEQRRAGWTDRRP